MKRGTGRPPAYKCTDGKRVPGATTILSRYKDSGGLIHWAWKQGVEGLDYRKTRDDAADAGSLAHDLIECEIHGEIPIVPPGTDPEIETRARSALENYRQWKESNRLEIIETEQPFVSELYRFGGTLDAIGILRGNLCLIDWKTSNQVYADYLCQIAAYTLLWEEFRDQPIKEAHLLRFDKEFGSFAHHRWDRKVIDTATEAFLLMRKLYDLDAVLKRAAA